MLSIASVAMWDFERVERLLLTTRKMAFIPLDLSWS